MTTPRSRSRSRASAWPPTASLDKTVGAAWRRLERLLTWRRARAYALVLVALYVVAWVDVVATGDPPLNSGGVPIAGDYIAFHTAARLVLSGHAAEMYSHPSVVAVQDGLLGGRIPNFYDAYRNPPFYALLYVPLAWLDLLKGFAVWCLVSLGCLALALRLLLEETPWLKQRWRGLLVFIFAFPPVYFGLIDGENAMVSLLLFALIYRALVRRQDTALGLWSALGLFKPQLFVVFPLVMLFTRRWKALAVYGVTALMLCGVSLALVGVDGMQGWARILLEPEGGNATVNGWRMASAKSFFDGLLPGAAWVSLALYLATSLVLVASLARAWTRREVNLPAAWLLTCLVAVLVDPHLVDYDLTVLISAGVIAAACMPRLAWAILPLYLVTLSRAQITIGDLGSLQLTAPLLALCAVCAFRWTRQGAAAQATPAVRAALNQSSTVAVHLR